MRKWIVLTVLALTLSHAFAGCGSTAPAGDGASSSGGGSAPTAGAEASAGSDSGASAEPVVWKFGSAFGTGDQCWDIQMPIIKETIERVTNGLVTVEMYEPDTICPGDDVQNAVQNGTLQGGLTAPANTCAIVPAAYAESLPVFYSMTEEDTYAAYYESGLYEFLYENYYNAGLVYLGYGPNGSMMLATNWEVRAPEDLSGHIVRVPASLATFFELCGASTTFIPGGELYMALKLGTIDGTNFSLPELVSMGLGEVAPYCIPSMLKGGYGSIIVNQKAFEALPGDIQEALKETFTNEIYWRFCEEAAKLEESVYTDGEAMGVTFTSLTDEEIAAFEAKIIPFLEQAKKTYPQAADGFQLLIDWKQKSA